MIKITTDDNVKTIDQKTTDLAILAIDLSREFLLEKGTRPNILLVPDDNIAWSGILEIAGMHVLYAHCNIPVVALTQDTPRHEL